MKKSKYRNVRVCRCLSCGEQAATFDSKAEWSFFWFELKPRIDLEQIAKLEIHPEFMLPGGVRVLADFSWIDCHNQKKYVVDVKGKSAPLTRSYVRNRKMIEAVHGIRIEVVRYDAK
jgi:hypothetical protein